MDSPEDYLINMAAEGHAGALEEFVSHQGEGALGPKVRV